MHMHDMRSCFLTMTGFTIHVRKTASKKYPCFPQFGYFGVDRFVPISSLYMLLLLYLLGHFLYHQFVLYNPPVYSHHVYGCPWKNHVCISLGGQLVSVLLLEEGWLLCQLVVMGVLHWWSPLRLMTSTMDSWFILGFPLAAWFCSLLILLVEWLGLSSFLLSCQISLPTV